jgi:hypothetical protein
MFTSYYQLCVCFYATLKDITQFKLAFAELDSYADADPGPENAVLDPRKTA